MFAVANGMAETAPAASTPGSCDSRSSVEVKKVRRCSGVGFRSCAKTCSDSVGVIA